MNPILTEAVPIERRFFERSTEVVAEEILGTYLIRDVDGSRIVCRVVEAEAYLGQGDPASHACRGMTKRNAVMFGKPGISYVYLNYGVHWMLNAVTEPEGTAGAVLIRAVEPVEGISVMLQKRPVASEYDLTSGPGKLTKALGIGPEEHGLDLTDPAGGLFFAWGDGKPSVKASARIGISVGTESLLRFYVEGSAFVSRKL
ncbi:MAG: DNA-3-methyladenine glycosylase [Candidatus Aquicultorales bacterium]